MQLSKKKNDCLFYALLLLLPFVFWKNSASFFWRDEWQFMNAFRGFKFSFLLEPHFYHIVPIFKLFYFIQLKIFGINAQLFHYTNLILFGLIFIVLFKLFICRLYSAWHGFFICVIILAHPINFNHLLWSFQVGITLQLFFQSLSIYYLFKYLESSGWKYFLLTFVFAILQNYSFGNGLLFPLLIFLFLLFTKNKRKITIPIVLFLLILFVSIQVLLGKSEQLLNNIPENILPIANSFIIFIGTNLARFFFLRENLLGNTTLYFSIFLFLILLLIGILNKKTDKKIIIIYSGWFLLSNTLIPIAKASSILEHSMPHYYSTLSFIPFGLLISEIVKPWVKNIEGNKKVTSLLFASIVSIMLVFFTIDNMMVNTFTIRSIRNEANFNQAVSSNTPYYAFDDPYFCNPQFSTKGCVSWVQNPKEIYEYWDKHTIFHLSSDLKNN